MGRILLSRIGGLRGLLGLVVLAVVLAVAGCSTGDDGEESAQATDTAGGTDTTQLPPSSADVRLTLVASSSAREVFERLVPLFNRTPEGDGVLVEGVYGNSLETNQHVGYGLETHVFAPLSPGDLPGLIQSGQVPPDWEADEFGGLVATSTVVFVVRPGNPKGIRSWADVAKPGTRVLLADPEFSGIARWATLAAYSSELQRGGTAPQARAFLRRVLANATLHGRAGRDSLTAFTRGTADVLLTTEAEAITAQRKGSPLEYVVPDETMLVELPIVVVPDSPPEARAFVDFLRTEPAQRVFAEEGYRPVLDGAAAAADFPAPKSLARLRDLGSARDVYIDFFGSAASTVPALLLELGIAREE